MDVLWILGSLLLADLLTQVFFARLIIPHFERDPKLRARSYPPRPSSDEFTVHTPDGIKLHGSVLRAKTSAPTGAVIYCHEFDGNRWSFQEHCDRQIFAGHDMVVFDFRNHGQSARDPRSGRSHWLTRPDVVDVQTVINWVRQNPRWQGIPITLMGVSRGANAALAAADSNIAGVIAVGAFATHDLAMQHLLVGIRRFARPILAAPLWHIRSTLVMAIWWSGVRRRLRFEQVERSLARLRRLPILFIAGDEDAHVDHSLQKRLADRVPTATFWRVPGGRHNLERAASPQEYDSRVREFLWRVSRSSDESIRRAG